MEQRRMMRILIALLGAGLIAILAASAARADVVHLRDGRSIEGKIVEETRAFVRIETPFGGVRKIEQSRILRIEHKKTPKELYEARMRRTDPSDADALFEVGLWARKQGLAVESLETFRKVLALEPDHEGARRALGYERRGGKWVRSSGKKAAPAPAPVGSKAPAAEAQATSTDFSEGFLSRSGFVQYKGDWITTREQRLLEEGLVRYGGRFVSPADLARCRQGLVEDGGSWIPRAQADARHDTWDTAWEIDTLHYHIRTDWPRENADRVADLLERDFREYARIFGGPPRAKMTLYLFRRKGDYEDYLVRHRLEKFRDKDAFFDARSRLVIGWGGKNYALVERIIGGNGAWQYYYGCYENALPSWFSEGIAIYFRRFGFDADGRYVRARPDRLRLGDLLRLARTDSLIPLGELIRMEYFAVYNEGRIGPFSAQSLALVQYFLHAADDGTRVRFFRFLDRLHKTHFVMGNADFLGAQFLEETFGEEGMRRIEKEYVEAARATARSLGVPE